VEALKIYSRKGFAEEIEEKAGIIKDMLGRLRNHPAVADVRTLGMIGAVEFRGECGSNSAQETRAALMKNGILTRPLGNVIYIMPPLSISRKELAELCGALTSAMTHLR
jgi:adenosylmethionine-8-amino-7-oxononanoate aminotransferase